MHSILPMTMQQPKQQPRRKTDFQVCKSFSKSFMLCHALHFLSPLAKRIRLSPFGVAFSAWLSSLSVRMAAASSSVRMATATASHSQRNDNMMCSDNSVTLTFKQLRHHYHATGTKSQEMWNSVFLILYSFIISNFCFLLESLLFKTKRLVARAGFASH